MTKDKSEFMKKTESKLVPVIFLVGICARVWRAPERLKKFCTYIFANALVVLWLCGGGVVLLPFVISAQESVFISWQPSPAPNVTGYNVYYGLASHDYISEISVGDNTNATISGLVAGTEYFFAATATDSSGHESEFSNETSYNVPTVGLSPPPPPPPPSSPTLTNGSYSGLFYEPNAIRPQSAGAFKLSVSTGGAYSGSLQLGKAQLRFSGLLGPSGQAAIQIPRKNTNALALIFSPGPSNQINGTVSDGTWTASLYGELMTRRFATNNAGKYMLVIQGNTSTSPSLGNGFGVLTVKSAETVTFVGALADGTKWSQGASYTESGKCPLYVSLYSGNGLAMGWLTLATASQDGLTGLLSWIKPPTPESQFYPDELAVQCATFRSLYNPAWALFLNLVTANEAYGGAGAHNPTDGESALLGNSK